MTTGQIIVLCIIGVLYFITFIISTEKYRSVWFHMLSAFNFVGIGILFLLTIVSVTELNKKLTPMPTDRYEQVATPSDTLYRKIK